MATETNPKEMSRELQESVAAVRDGVRNFIDRGSERAGDMKDTAMARGRDAMSAIERTIEHRPFMVIGGVFLGGMLLGLWLRRS